MTLDNTTDNTLPETPTGLVAGAGDTAAPAPAKAPRRRATRKTAAPAALPDPLETAPAGNAGSAAEAAPAADDAAAAPPRVRAARKTAAKKAPAKRTASTRARKAAGAASSAEQPAAEQPAAEQPAAVAAEPLDLPIVPVAVTTPPVVAVEVPSNPARASTATFDVFAELAATKTPRRAVRKARVADRSAAPVIAAPVAIAPAAVVPAEVLPVELDVEEEAEIITRAETPQPAPVRSSTDLLFQTADPTVRPRRRRAQSPAGPPRVAVEETPVVESTPSPQPSGSPFTVDPDQQIAEPAPARRTSRRRGSSRSSGPVVETGTEPVTTDVDAPESSTEGAPAAVGARGAGDSTSADQAPDDRPEDEDAGDDGPRRRRRRGGRGRRGRSGSDSSETDQPDSDGTDGGSENRADGSSDSGSKSGSPDGSDDRSDNRSGNRTSTRLDLDLPAAVDASAGADDSTEQDTDVPGDADENGGSSRRRRRRRRSGRGGEGTDEPAQPTRVRAARSGGHSGGSGSNIGATGADEVTALRGSTRLEAKRQRRREGRDAGRRRTIITESEFLARRESVDRSMVVREINGATQIAVMEDGVLVEHYVSRQAQASMAGNVYLGRVQNVLPSMEAAFVDVGKGRNAVLYAGEVNWDAAGLEGQPRRIEQALKSGDSVLVQVTKDPIGQKGARLTSQITLAGRYLVYVPAGGMTGISRKLPENERARLKKLLREIVPDSAGVIVRTAAEGASEDELRADIARLQEQWAAIEKKAKSASAPALLQGEPDLAIRVVRDIFNDDFGSLVVEGAQAWETVSGYIGALAPDLAEKVTRWTGTGDVFAAHRVDEQLAKGMDRKVWLPSGGSLVIDRTEAMTVVDVNTGKFTGAGGTLEETVTRNNLEAAEEIVRQLRLRDIGGIIVIDFIDMVLESNRDLVLRRLVECLGRDRTKHQVAEVTSLGLVQMTRKRVGQGLVEAFSETCEHCNGRGFIVHTDPIATGHADDGATAGHGHAATAAAADDSESSAKGGRRRRGGAKEPSTASIPMPAAVPVLPEARAAVKATLATIAAAAAHAHDTALGQQAGLQRPSVLGQFVETSQDGESGPADLPTGFDADETLELVPVDPDVFGVDGTDPAGSTPVESTPVESNPTERSPE